MTVPSTIRTPSPMRRSLPPPLLVYIVIALYISLFIPSSNAILPLRAVDILNQRDDRESSSTTKPFTSDEPKGNVDELYIEQPLDHFSSSPDVNGTLRQRYFYTDRYASNSSTVQDNVPAYAFLCVGGEGPSLDKSVLIDSVHCTGDMLELARILHEEHNALVHLFAIEHRYYGSSFPVFCNTTNDTNQDDSCSPASTTHLQYLSSRQALADLARFVSTQNEKFQQKLKWITFGGSYPGMLAAWARVEYPELIHAAVSNSAPIQATLDFGGYNEWVGLDLRYSAVGGSDECYRILVEGHADIAEALENNQEQDVAGLFRVCNASSLLNKKNIDMFLGDGVIEIPAQSNDPNCNSGMCNIEQICSTLIDESRVSTAMQALATVAHLQNYFEEECLTLDWNATLDALISPTRSKTIRSWLWQTCTEFGFYQTCHENSQCPYGRGHHMIDMDLEICEVAFGVSSKDVEQNVKDTLEYYGGLGLKNATRILSVNGNVDPWSVLARRDSSSTDLPTHWVEGASHHFWTHEIKDSDDERVVEARHVIYHQVMQWLSVEDDYAVEYL